jgi:LPS-assembly protein
MVTSLPQLEADQQAYDTETKTLSASGNVILNHQELTLQSEQLDVDQNAGKVTATEDVRLTQGRFRVVADQISYQYPLARFEAEVFRLGAYPFYFQGDSIAGTMDNIQLGAGTLYFLEPGPYSLRVTGESFTLTDQQKLKVTDATLRVGDFPVFYLPEYTQDLSQDSPLLYRGEVGARDDLGGYVQNRLLVRVSPEVKIGANLDGYSKRGVLAGPAGEYLLKPEDGPWLLEGSLDTGFLHDFGSNERRGTDAQGQQIGTSRYFMHYEGLGLWGDQIDHATRLQWWSDSEVLRDFRYETYKLDQLPDTFTETAYRTHNGVFSLMLRPEVNDAFETTQRLPELTYRHQPTPLTETSEVLHHGHASFVRLVENDISGTLPTQQSHRFSAYYGWSYPLHSGDVASLSPVVGGLLTHYEGTEPVERSTTRLVGEIGFDAEAHATGTWELSSDIWGIDGLRHTVRPVAQYRYLPGAKSQRSQIPAIDRRAAFDTYLQPLSLSQRRDIDALYETHTLRLGIDNQLLTRQTDYGSRTLARLSLFQDLRFEQPDAGPRRFTTRARPDEGTWSDLHTDLQVMPAYWLNGRVFTRVCPEDGALNQVSTRIDVIDGDRWTLSFGNDYLRDTPLPEDVHQYMIGAGYRINDRNRVRARWRFDAGLNELIEQFYGWEMLVGRSWAVEARLTLLEGNAREGDVSVSLSGRLLTF